MWYLLLLIDFPSSAKVGTSLLHWSQHSCRSSSPRNTNGDRGPSQWTGQKVQNKVLRKIKNISTSLTLLFKKLNNIRTELGETGGESKGLRKNTYSIRVENK